MLGHDFYNGWIINAQGSSCPWNDPPDSQSHGNTIQLSPVDAHGPILEVGFWEFALTPMALEVAVMQQRKALPGLHTWHTKWSLPTSDRIVCSVADWQPEMSLSSEIVSERWLGSIMASMVTESMSTLRKLVVAAGFVTFWGLTVKPSSSHVAILVTVLLAQTGESGGPRVK